MAFIGWKPEDIQGRNISLLMADDAASRHDEYLERSVGICRQQYFFCGLAFYHYF